MIGASPGSHGIAVKNTVPFEVTGASQPGASGRTGTIRLTSSASPSQRASGSASSARSRWGAIRSTLARLRPADWEAGRCLAVLTASASVPMTT
jgi:hypothetical protein